MMLQSEKERNIVETGNHEEDSKRGYVILYEEKNPSKEPSPNNVQ